MSDPFGGQRRTGCFGPPWAPSRRDLLRAAALGSVVVAGGSTVAGARSSARARGAGDLSPVRYALHLAPGQRAPLGAPGPVLLASGAFPAPEIRLREGFLLRVEVANGLSEPTALHWHGLVVSNPMDGEIGVTQLPIEPGTVAVYELAPREPGTYWYHATAGFQRQLGLGGALVVTEREDPHRVTQDRVVFLSDWLGSDPAEVLPALRDGHPAPEPVSEGRRPVHPGPDGAPFATDREFAGFLMNGQGLRKAWTCRAQTGERVRLRIVNGSAQTFFRFAITGHRLEVVAADGRPVDPVVVDDLVVATGERYDVVVEVGASGSYAIRAAALGQAGSAVGVLHTPDAQPVVSVTPPEWGGRTLRYEMLRSAEADVAGGTGGRTLRLFVDQEGTSYGFTVGGDGEETVTSRSQGDPTPLALRVGERVGIELFNRTRFHQAVHLHGHVFRLLCASVDPRWAPRKDTVSIAPDGRVRLELRADNPGRWLLEGTGLYRRRAGLSRVLTYVVGSPRA